jgi:hypothetical protein
VSEFLALTYEVGTDKMRWQRFTRQKLIDQAVRVGVLRAHDFPRGAYRAALFRRIAKDNLIEAEREAVLNEWADWWRIYGSAVIDASAGANLLPA